MCLPIAAAAVSMIGTGLTAAGTVVSGISAYQAGQANKSAYNAQAQATMQKAEYDVENAARAFQRHRGKVIAGAAAESIDLTSFYDVMADDAAEAALEQKAIRVGAANNAANLRYQGRVAAAQGTAALVGSVFSAAGSGFSGYGKAYGTKGK